MRALSRPARWSPFLFLVTVIAASVTGLHAQEEAQASAQVQAQEGAESFRIGTGDVLRIDVWKEPDLSSTVTVRPDGIISLPVVGDFKAAGLTPEEVQTQLAAALGEVITAPTLTVIVEQVNSRKIFVTGKVATPGVYDLTQPTRVLHAIALAGGTTDFAKTDRIVVLRDGARERLKVNMKAIAKGRHLDDNILLQPGDTIIVPWAGTEPAAVTRGTRDLPSIPRPGLAPRQTLAIVGATSAWQSCRQFVLAGLPGLWQA
jgi:polysaccharide export outer membrane protein